MKAAILAGRMGTRSLKKANKSKAFVDRSMHYSSFGFHEFTIALCCKGECNRRRQYLMGKRTLGKIDRSSQIDVKWLLFAFWELGAVLALH